MRSFCASRFTLNLLAYGTEHTNKSWVELQVLVELGAVLLVKLNSIFLHQMLYTSAFEPCASGLVKLTPKRMVPYISLQQGQVIFVINTFRWWTRSRWIEEQQMLLTFPTSTFQLFNPRNFFQEINFKNSKDLLCWKVKFPKPDLTGIHRGCAKTTSHPYGAERGWQVTKKRCSGGRG